MPEVKSLDRISNKWSNASNASTGEYEFGVKNPKKDWATETANAENNYKAGVQKAANEGRFGKGVKKAGTAKWQENTLNKGVNRWADGISKSKSNYEKGFAPYRETIINTTLSPRGPKGDPNNIKRVAEMAQALHKKKQDLRNQ